jgi:6-phosphogluconate dehydrogenase
MASPVCEFGVFGMGVMGQNLALNIAERGYKLAAYNRPDEFQVHARRPHAYLNALRAP